MNCVQDMVISSEFFNISSYTRLIWCFNGQLSTPTYIRSHVPLMLQNNVTLV